MEIKTKYVQQCINDTINANLVVDGFMGANTANAVAAFQAKLKSVLAALNYQYLENTPIGIRLTDDLTDKFTDWLVMFKGDNTMFAIPISTKPSTAAEREKKEVVNNGKKGVAVLKEQQVLNGWQLKKDTCTGGLHYFMQVKEVVIYRDNIVDSKLDRNCQTDKGFYGINLHSWLNWMQNILWYKSTNREISLSEGCQVAKADDWGLFINEILKTKKVGDCITYTLIHKNFFN